MTGEQQFVFFFSITSNKPK